MATVRRGISIRELKRIWLDQEGTDVRTVSRTGEARFYDLRELKRSSPYNNRRKDASQALISWVLRMRPELRGQVL